MPWMSFKGADLENPLSLGMKLAGAKADRCEENEQAQA